MSTHELKTWSAQFEAVWKGQKLYEIRKDDRNFRVGDCLRLMEWVPENQSYTGRMITARVRYITKGEFGLPSDLCVMSLEVINRAQYDTKPEPNTVEQSTPKFEPVKMLLTCPMCNTRHIDCGEFAWKVHHTHACQGCGHVWRPAVEATVGVQFLPGFKD